MQKLFVKQNKITSLLSMSYCGMYIFLNAVFAGKLRFQNAYVYSKCIVLDNLQFLALHQR